MKLTNHKITFLVLLILRQIRSSVHDFGIQTALEIIEAADINTCLECESPVDKERFICVGRNCTFQFNDQNKIYMKKEQSDTYTEEDPTETDSNQPTTSSDNPSARKKMKEDPRYHMHKNELYMKTGNLRNYHIYTVQTLDTYDFVGLEPDIRVSGIGMIDQRISKKHIVGNKNRRLFFFIEPEEQKEYVMKQTTTFNPDYVPKKCLNELMIHLHFHNNPHPNVCRIHKIFFSKRTKRGSYLNIVMTGVKHTLRGYLQLKPFDMLFLENLVGVVRALHENRIIHQDIKCSNMLVDENGRIMMVDFWKSLRIGLTSKLKGPAYSINYRAPEVENLRLFSFKADIFALGCTIYILLKNKPFRISILEQDLNPTVIYNHIDLINAEITQPFFRQILIHCLYWNQKKRKTIAEISQLIEDQKYRLDAQEACTSSSLS